MASGWSPRRCRGVTVFDPGGAGMTSKPEAYSIFVCGVVLIIGKLSRLWAYSTRASSGASCMTACGRQSESARGECATSSVLWLRESRSVSVRGGNVNDSVDREVIGVMAIGDTETLKATGLEVVVIGDTKPSVVRGSVVVASE